MQAKVTLIINMFYLTGCSGQNDEQRNTTHLMAGKILWTEPKENSENTDTRIISIRLERDICNVLTLEITYFNKGDLPGYVCLSPNAGVPGQSWPMHPKMKQGLHTMQVQNGIQCNAEAVKSHELTVAIEHIADNKWAGYIDRRSTGFEKNWNNNCL